MKQIDGKRVMHKGTNGTVYVYEIVESGWDKEKRQPRNRQVCIGKLDPVSGELIPSKRLGEHGAAALDPAVTARTSISGPALLLDNVDQDIGLSRILKKACPDQYREILSLSWFILSTGNALSHADSWCKSHEVPSGASLSSQRVSDLLSVIGEDERQTFFRLWGKQIAERDYLCYDITSISSYSEQNEYVRKATEGKSMLSTKSAPISVPVIEVVPATEITVIRMTDIEQSPFDVSKHLRNLHEGWEASATKIATAAEYGYNLQPGQTWVDSFTNDTSVQSQSERDQTVAGNENGPPSAWREV